MGKLLRGIAGDGSLVCTVIDSTDIAAEAERLHKTSAVVTAALGRLLTAGAMMGQGLKNREDSVTLRLAGDGPAGVLIVVADSSGNPRGYVENAIVELPLNRYGKLDVAGAVGSAGTLTVIKEVGLPEPSTGTVPLISGEIAEDVTSYFAVSEQTPTVCALGVLVNPELTVRKAGGYLLQLMPGAQEQVIQQVERNLDGIRPVTEMLDSGMTVEEIMERLLAGFDPQILDEAAPEYRCNCSKKRVERALVSIGREELEKLAQEQETTQVSCHFCNKTYTFNQQQVRALIR